MPVPPLIIAHRGASADAPENTLPAFELAWKQGADAIEGDFRLTADGQVVCIHDADTMAVARERLVVSETSLAELQALDLGATFGSRWSGVRIPALPQVLATVPAGGQLFIEVKCGDEILPRLFEDIDQSAVEDGQVTVISYNKDVIASSKARRPAVRAHWITRMKRNLLGKRVPSVEAVVKLLQGMGADGLSACARDRLSAREVQRLLDEGLECHVWTVDRPGTARAFLRRGASSITTNRPGFMRQQLVR
jgi:glycerophosphoryl diester phosphodiesterase